MMQRALPERTPIVPGRARTVRHPRRDGHNCQAGRPHGLGPIDNKERSGRNPSGTIANSAAPDTAVSANSARRRVAAVGSSGAGPTAQRAGQGLGPEMSLRILSAANPLWALGARLGLVSAPTLQDGEALLGEAELSDWSGKARAPAVTTLEVTGMTCAACSTAVERALLGLPGALTLGFLARGQPPSAALCTPRADRAVGSANTLDQPSGLTVCGAGVVGVSVALVTNVARVRARARAGSVA